MSTGSGLFSFLSCNFDQMFGQIVSIIRKRLRNTILVLSIYFKMKKISLLVDVHSSKTPLLKLPNIMWPSWMFQEIMSISQLYKNRYTNIDCETFVQKFVRIKIWVFWLLLPYKSRGNYTYLYIKKYILFLLQVKNMEMSF